MKELIELSLEQLFKIRFHSEVMGYFNFDIFASLNILDIVYHEASQRLSSMSNAQRVCNTCYIMCARILNQHIFIGLND